MYKDRTLGHVMITHGGVHEGPEAAGVGGDAVVVPHGEVEVVHNLRLPGLELTPTPAGTPTALAARPASSSPICTVGRRGVIVVVETLDQDTIRIGTLLHWCLKQQENNKTPAKHRDIFRSKCNASARVRTHDLVSVRQTHYQLRHGD